jgi:hypothetical protein
MFMAVVPDYVEVHRGLVHLEQGRQLTRSQEYNVAAATIQFLTQLMQRETTSPVTPQSPHGDLHELQPEPPVEDVLLLSRLPLPLPPPAEKEKGEGSKTPILSLSKEKREGSNTPALVLDMEEPEEAEPLVWKRRKLPSARHVERDDPAWEKPMTPAEISAGTKHDRTTRIQRGYKAPTPSAPSTLIGKDEPTKVTKRTLTLDSDEDEAKEAAKKQKLDADLDRQMQLRQAARQLAELQAQIAKLQKQAEPEDSDAQSKG